jgi:predicted kinase
VTEARKPTLTLTRGLPGSGKSTWARAQRHAVRVNRDDLRRMLHGGRTGENWAEVQVSLVQRAQIDALLRAGVNVICDDTNLRSRALRELAEIGLRAGATIEVKDFFDIPVEECIARDANRTDGERVGEDAIRGMFQRYLAGRRVTPPVPAFTTATGLGEPYLPPDGMPEAVLVDIDGTVAVMGDRSPYDMTQVHIDTPHQAVIAAVRAMRAAGYRVVFCSGRSEDARAATEAWLAEHLEVAYDALHMRKVGDQRRDSVVKAEIFERELRHAYRIVCVFDDRDQVVRMWRSYGLTVFQVAEGAF